MEKINFNKTFFVTSAPDMSKLPDDIGIEIAFVGRSNAGKSSALNIITNKKNLAKTSKTPGRTQLINVFNVIDDKRIIDLPGYGYAAVPLQVKKKWQKALTEYLQHRKSLKAIVVLMDIRHPLKDLDRQILTWAALSNLQVLILLTKSDKLKKQYVKNALIGVKKDLIEFGCNYDILPFSSVDRTGVEEAKDILSNYFNCLHSIASNVSCETLEEEKNFVFDEEAWQKNMDK
ncbi:MAG: ribosome biogenesis GTP-binding protein YihA/YsxC [Succinivibrionaceae bacterium]